jgi:hypothetical protein
VVIFDMSDDEVVSENDADVMPVFRGHVDECFKDLIKHLSIVAPRYSRHISQVRTQLREFCMITDHTATAWIYSDFQMPQGESLIRLHCFLKLCGYDVIEHKISQALLKFTELIGYKIISVDEAMKLLNYRKASSLYAMLAGKHKVPPLKSRTIWETFQKHQHSLQEAKNYATTHLDPVYKVGQNLDGMKAGKVSVHSLFVEANHGHDKPPNTDIIAVEEVRHKTKEEKSDDVVVDTDLISQGKVIREITGSLMQNLTILLDSGVFKDASEKESRECIQLSMLLSSRLSSLVAELIARKQPSEKE